MAEGIQAVLGAVLPGEPVNLLTPGQHLRLVRLPHRGSFHSGLRLMRGTGGGMSPAATSRRRPSSRRTRWKRPLTLAIFQGLPSLLRSSGPVGLDCGAFQRPLPFRLGGGAFLGCSPRKVCLPAIWTYQPRSARNQVSGCLGMTGPPLGVSRQGGRSGPASRCNGKRAGDSP